MSRKYDKVSGKQGTRWNARPPSLGLEFDFFEILRDGAVIKMREAEDLFSQSESHLEGCGIPCLFHLFEDESIVCGIYDHGHPCSSWPRNGASWVPDVNVLDGLIDGNALFGHCFSN